MLGVCPTTPGSLGLRAQQGDVGPQRATAVVSLSAPAVPVTPCSTDGSGLLPLPGPIPESGDGGAAARLHGRQVGKAGTHWLPYLVTRRLGRKTLYSAVGSDSGSGVGSGSAGLAAVARVERRRGALAGVSPASAGASSVASVAAAGLLARARVVFRAGAGASSASATGAAASSAAGAARGRRAGAVRGVAGAARAERAGAVGAPAVAGASARATEGASVVDRVSPSVSLRYPTVRRTPV